MMARTVKEYRLMVQRELVFQSLTPELVTEYQKTVETESYIEIWEIDIITNGDIKFLGVL